MRHKDLAGFKDMLLTCVRVNTLIMGPKQPLLYLMLI